MALIADTVAGLGTPRSAGTIGTVRMPSVSVDCVWTGSMWVTPAELTMRQVSTVGMRNAGPITAKYGNLPSTDAPLKPTAFGFQIHPIPYADEYSAAGFTMQQLLRGFLVPYGSGADTVAASLFLNAFSLALGDPFLSPDPTNHGIELPAFLIDPADAHPPYRACDTGWQTSPADAISKLVGYLELYGLGSQLNFKYFTALHRWAGGDGVPNAGESGARASAYPAGGPVMKWFRADTIPVLDGAHAAEWGGYSGRGEIAAQATSGKQPTVTRDLTGPRYVHFNGSSILRDPSGTFSQPVTILATIRQNNTGAAKQVWLGPNQSGASLFYRFDNTHGSVWAGGSDLQWTRAWPMPFTVVSAVLDTTTTVWADTTPVASGDAGAFGFAGLTIGGNNAEDLLANADYVEIALIAGAMGDTPRTALVNAMRARAGLT